jgi:uncharacterized membrane protein required for colicin V production
MVDLTTTNVLLGVMAVVSVLEAIALMVGAVMAYRFYQRVNVQLQVLEEQHVRPLRAQASAILETVQRISSHVEHSTDRVDAAVQGTMERAELAVDTVHNGARRTAGTVVGVLRGVRTAIGTFLESTKEA